MCTRQINSPTAQKSRCDRRVISFCSRVVASFLCCCGSLTGGTKAAQHRPRSLHRATVHLLLAVYKLALTEQCTASRTSVMAVTSTKDRRVGRMLYGHARFSSKPWGIPRDRNEALARFGTNLESRVGTGVAWLCASSRFSERIQGRRRLGREIAKLTQTGLSQPCEIESWFL